MNKKGKGLNPLVMSVVLVVLFSFFIFTFVGLVLQEQNPGSEVLDSKYKLNESIDSMKDVTDDFETVSTNIRGQMDDANPTAVDFIFLIFQAAFYIPKVFITFVFVGFTALTETIFPMLAGTGLGTLLSLTLALISASIMITIVLLIVKAIRTGESQN